MKEREKINSAYFPVKVKNHLILQILLTAIWGWEDIVLHQNLEGPSSLPYST